MFEALDHPALVPFDGTFRIDRAPTAPDGAPEKSELKKELARLVDELSDLQERLYAEDRTAVLAIFQAMDAAGKDGTIGAVTTGINPAGCQVHSFKRPSLQDLEHDFLWRHVWPLPPRGTIGIFNRSWYEEALVVRVHPEILEDQRLPWRPKKTRKLWDERLESMADYERHLARNGTVVLKFFLNISKDEQKRRFLSRIDDPAKNWKFEEGDVRERGFWDDYQVAYEAALNATSRPWAPWYAIPADEKPYMRVAVARILVDTMKALDPKFPVSDADESTRLANIRRLLEAEKD
jgi:PPK2 family polyphosphate:nucleotide phosphotransferase